MRTMGNIGIIIILFISFQLAEALIAFDCGHEKMNKTRISLLKAGECDIKVPNITHEVEDIQLLEINDVAYIHAYQCKVNILQSIYYCGMFSHLSLVPGGLSSFILDISKEECMKIHRNNTFRLQNNKLISGIQGNASTHRTETIAGVVDSNGYCQGSTFSYGSKTWDNVIVMQTFELTITDYPAVVSLEDNQIILRNNLRCQYLHQQCMDIELGMSFWDLIPNESCENLKYHVLYEGNATRAQTKDLHTNDSHIIYTVSAGDVVFALEIIKPISVCRYNGFQTEHPRLVIVHKAHFEYLFKKKADNSKNLDLLTYVNAKFVYVERHIKSQIQSLYINLVHKKCELERDVIKMQLSVAHNHPAEFALMRMKELGYTAVSRGEILYLIKCQAVEVTVRQASRCYNELPVTYNNNSFFMAPTTHLLQEYGTEIPCSTSLIPAYYIQGSWYGFSPQGHRMEPPGSLNPAEDIPWNYEDPHDLVKVGIYSSETSESLRRQIMYPVERRAIENVITRALTGHDTDHQNINILHLFSSDHFSQIKGFLQNTWWVLRDFGAVYSCATFIWIVVKVIKYLFSLVVNLTLIRQIHGRSWWLIAAFCTTCTTFILHKNMRNSENPVEVISAQPTSSHESTSHTNHSTDLQEVVCPQTNPITLQSLQAHTKLYPDLHK